MSLILTDVAVQRQVLLERFKAAKVREYTDTLRKTDAYIRDQLTRTNLTAFRRSRLESQLSSMREALSGQYKEYIGALNVDMEALAASSAEFESNLFKAYAPGNISISTPAPNQVWSAVNTNPLSMTSANGGSTLQAFMDQWADGDADMVTNAIRQGYLLGETNDQIIARIRGTAEARFTDGILAKNRAHAETVTRTAIQHVANTARAETWAANDDIIDEYEWISTLDSRTTPLCRDRDKKRFPVGAGPLPPAHPNCRSTTVAVIKGEFGRLLEEESSRASVNGQVPANESYYDWLKRQPADFQDMALGPTRGKLFRDGGLSTDVFSRLQLGKNFDPMTLDEMRSVAPDAFARAGLGGPGPSVRPFDPVSARAASSLAANGELTSPVPAAVAKAARAYSGASYSDINKYLRSGRSSAPVFGDTPEFTRLLADALGKSTMSADVVLYRGIRLDGLFDGVEDLSTLVGRVFEDDGFMSFSTSPSAAAKFGKGRGKVVMKVWARSGDEGYMSLRNVSHRPDEQEVLRRGGRFRVVGVDPDDGALIVEPL